MVRAINPKNWAAGFLIWAKGAVKRESIYHKIKKIHRTPSLLLSGNVLSFVGSFPYFYEFKQIPVQDSSIITHYFPDLTEKQLSQFAALGPLYREWNEKINVISRKDIDNLYVNHVLHSLAIGRVISFLPEADILDVGTGGGFPGVPLAILFPDTRFHLVDSIGKKITVVKEVSNALGLENVLAEQNRAEQLKKKYDFIVSRAVTQMQEFYGWVNNKVKQKSVHTIDNGILYLKGGDLDEEMDKLKRPYSLYDLPSFFSEEFFETKKVVYMPL